MRERLERLLCVKSIVTLILAGTFGGLLGGPAPISKKEQDRKKRLAKLARKERQKQRKRRK